MESGFKPMAKSGKGARGLMQLMPSTAEWIANKNGIAYSEELLVNAEYNLELGCAYLSYLSSRFDGKRNIAAAYNAGEGDVRKWLNDLKKTTEREKPKSAALRKLNRYIK